MTYRIRWALVYVGDRWERRCLAERRVKFLGLFPIWWPVDGDWRYSEQGAMWDIEEDQRLRQPLPETRVIP